MRPLLAFALFAGLFSCAHADLGSEATLWIPERMILGHTYHGMILVDEATPEGLLILLSAEDDHIVDIPDSVPIRPYQNHGIFSITPVSKGITDIFVAGDAGLQRMQVEVISPKSEPARLKVVPASDRVLADSVTSYVLILDEGGSPVRVDHNLEIHLTSSSSIGSPYTILVKNGTYYSKLDMDVRGTGHITASADGLEPHTIDIQKTQHDITVRLAVAPDIAMQDSHAYYYVWLEKDGRPFKPPHVVDAYLHSRDPGTASFTTNPSHNDYEGTMVRLVDGVSKGILYTGGRGQTVVTASTTEFGSGQDSIFVGPARVDIGDADIQIRRQNLVGKTDGGDHTPDLMLSWIYPSVTDDTAWVVMATYSTDHTLSPGLTADGAITGTITEDTVITPARPDGRSIIYASSNGGIIHDGAYRMEETITKTNAMEFEISGSSHGKHTLTVSGQGLEPGSSTVNIVPEYSEKFDLKITPLPALPDAVHDVAIVSVLDESGAMVDIPDTFGAGAKFLINSDSARMADDAVPSAGSNSAIVRGLLERPSRITVILDGVDPASTELIPSRTATSLEILTPDMVHIDEEFPFVVHQVDHTGTPIDMASNLRISSPLDVSVDSDHMTLNGGSGTGRISVISEIGAAEHEITGIANTMSIDLKFDKTNLRVGSDMTLDVINSIDAFYDLVTDLPFVQTDDSTFVITPDDEYDSTVITLLATRDGYEPVSISETFDVRRIFSLDVRAADPDGSRLAVQFDLYVDGTESPARTPHHAELGPAQIGIALPEKYTVHGHGYAAKSVMINGNEQAYGSILDVSLTQDVEIEAVYAREILVSVEGGLGSGVYEYGDVVTIDAPDREKLSFLIRDVFDHWDGLDGPDPRQTFVATHDVHVGAIYREDYTYLMIVIAGPLLAAGAFTMYRNTAGFRWRVENMLEKITSVARPVRLKRSSPKNPPNKDMKHHKGQ